MLAFRSLDRFGALREPDRRRGDEERLSRSEQRTLSKTQNNHLTGKAPYKFESISLHRRVCKPSVPLETNGQPRGTWLDARYGGAAPTQRGCRGDPEHASEPAPAPVSGSRFKTSPLFRWIAGTASLSRRRARAV